MIQPGDLSDPTVRSIVITLNAGDRDAFLAAFSDDATITWNGSDERDIGEWSDREIFSGRGHIDVESQSDGGRTLIARYSTSEWGESDSKWVFTISGDKVSWLEVGFA